MTDLIKIPARRGKAVRVNRGRIVRVINTHGNQVVDTWAFNATDLAEFMSMEHTRASCRKLTPSRGEAFVTNQRRPILTLEADTSPGVHDTLIAACDRYRYELLGHKGYHENCTDNLREALGELGLKPTETPCPLNLFMNIPVIAGTQLDWKPTVSKAGDSVGLRAEMDCVVVFSACPMDLLPINGVDCIPVDAHFFVE